MCNTRQFIVSNLHKGESRDSLWQAEIPILHVDDKVSDA